MRKSYREREREREREEEEEKEEEEKEEEEKEKEEEEEEEEEEEGEGEEEEEEEEEEDHDDDENTCTLTESEHFPADVAQHDLPPYPEQTSLTCRETRRCRFCCVYLSQQVRNNHILKNILLLRLYAACE